MLPVKRCAVVLLTLGFVGFWAGVRADEEKVALDKLPRAVAEAVNKRFPKAKMLEAAKETEKGKTVYEVTVNVEGKKIDVTVSPQGDLLGLEKEITRKDLPRAVTDALEKKYPKASYKTIEEVIKVHKGKETFEFYEVLLHTADKKKIEVKLGADGQIKGEEKQDEKQAGDRAAADDDEKAPLGSMKLSDQILGVDRLIC